MHKLYVLSIFVVLLIGCQKSSSNDPTPLAEYYMQVTADNQTYLLDNEYPKTQIFNFPARNGSLGTSDPGFVQIEARAKGQSPLFVSIKLNQALSGKPETINIRAGEFIKTPFEKYSTDLNSNKAGVITFTKVDNVSAEGDFTMDVYSNGSNTSKLPLKGQFKIRFSM